MPGTSAFTDPLTARSTALGDKLPRSLIATFAMTCSSGLKTPAATMPAPGTNCRPCHFLGSSPKRKLGRARPVLVARTPNAVPGKGRKTFRVEDRVDVDAIYLDAIGTRDPVTGARVPRHCCKANCCIQKLASRDDPTVMASEFAKAVMLTRRLVHQHGQKKSREELLRLLRLNHIPKASPAHFSPSYSYASAEGQTSPVKSAWWWHQEDGACIQVRARLLATTAFPPIHVAHNPEPPSPQRLVTWGCWTAYTNPSASEGIGTL